MSTAYTQGQSAILDGQIIRITNPDGIPFWPSTSVDVLLLSRARSQQGRSYWGQNLATNNGYEEYYPSIFSPYQTEAVYGEYRDEVFYPQNDNIGIMSLGVWWFPVGVNKVEIYKTDTEVYSIDVDLGEQALFGSHYGSNFNKENVVWWGGAETPLANPSNMSLENKATFTQSSSGVAQSASNYSLTFLKTSTSLPTISASPPNSNHTAMDYSSGRWGWEESGGFLTPKSLIYESDGQQHPLPYFYAAPATHRVNVNSRNIHHWSWSLDGGAETHMPAGSTYVDIVIGSAPEPDVGLLLQNTTGIGLYFSGTTVGPNPIPMPFVATEKSGTNLANGTSTMITNQGNGSLSWVINESGDLTIDMLTSPGSSYGSFVVTWPNWYQNYLDGTTSTNSVYWGPNTVFTSSYSNQTVRLIVP